MTRHQYDNDVHPDNVYGHALDLLRRQSSPTDSPTAPSASPEIHLDVASGFGNIAESIRDDFGLAYVGLDYDPDELASLEARGFETHRVDLMDPDLSSRLADVIAGRRVSSISFLDGLEHLTDGTIALAALAGLLAEHDAVLVTSVPNVTHLDVATKALLGEWDYTVSGLLDQTHYRLWSAASLHSAFEAAGLAVIDHYNVELEHSDQHFPDTHLALSTATSLGSWLSALRNDAAPHRHTNQFVWASRAGAATSPAPSPDVPDAPFMSVLVRADGDRPEALDETLLSLAAQTVTDFEVVVLAEETGDDLEAIRGQLAEHPPTLSDRMMLVPATGSSADVLNAGLTAARGTYVAFSDDVTWLGHWIESAQQKARHYPGRCIRGLVLEQEVATVAVGGAPGLRATSAPCRAGGKKFSLVEHVSTPLASTYGHAFPRSVFADMGVRIDESWGTVALRRHLLRAVELAGVVEIEEVVAIRQRPASAELEETPDDLARLVDAIDAAPYLIPTGAARRAIEASGPLAEKLNEAWGDIADLNESVELKNGHIVNIEAMLAAKVDELERLRGLLQQRQAKIKNLRAKLKALQDTDRPEQSKRPQRLRFRSSNK